MILKARKEIGSRARLKSLDYFLFYSSGTIPPTGRAFTAFEISPRPNRSNLNLGSRSRVPTNQIIHIGRDKFCAGAGHPVQIYEKSKSFLKEPNPNRRHFISTLV